MQVERNYIPSGQEAQTIQPQQETIDAGPVKEGLGRRLKRSRQYGALLAVMLAPSIAWGGYVRNENHNGEPPVHPLQIPTKPKFWGQVTNNAARPPVYNYQDGIAHPPSLSSVGAVYYGDLPNAAQCLDVNATGWVTKQTFQIDPNKTYKESLWEKHTNPGNSDIGGFVLISFKDQNGIGTGLFSDFLDHSATPTDWQFFERTTIIPPAATVSATLTLEVFPYSDATCDGTIHGVVDYDQVYFADESHPETNLILNPDFETPDVPASVGGIAEAPDLPPAAAVSHSSKDTLITNVEIAVGGAIALGAVAAAGLEVNKRRKRQG